MSSENGMSSENRMCKSMLVVLIVGWTAAGVTWVMGAGSEADFRTAIAAAQAANDEAGRLKNQWTTTAQTLADAAKAAAAHEYDKAIALARHAEALARASIHQAKEQQEAWKATAAIIH
ncbi:MAG TPA: hypothetical protein VH678_08550 [Xanthobacteraceae bacterium]|jgi:hypothetical protein